MGRLAAAVAVVGLVLCGALLGLMFAANEASKEGHVDGSVSVDLKGNPVQSKPLQSFASLLDFPKLEPSDLNQMDYVSFSATNPLGTSTIDTRFRISAWFQDQDTSELTLISQDGSKIVIQGDSSAAELTLFDDTWAVEVPARRRLADNSFQAPSPACQVLYSSEEELQRNCHEAAHPGNGDKRRELRRGGSMQMSRGSFTAMSANRAGND